MTMIYNNNDKITKLPNNDTSHYIWFLTEVYKDIRRIYQHLFGNIRFNCLFGQNIKKRKSNQKKKSRFELRLSHFKSLSLGYSLIFKPTIIIPSFKEIKNLDAIEFKINSKWNAYYLYYFGSYGKGAFTKHFSNSQIDNEEYLIDLNEAIYLSYFNLIDLLTLEGKKYDFNKLWKDCIEKYTVTVNKINQNDLINPFLTNYLAYHYLREQGWVVKNGLKFGLDFLLYKDGPIYRHSEYGVKVIPVKLSQFNQVDYNYINWIDIIQYSRLNSQVKKKLVLLYVIYPNTLPEVILFNDIEIFGFEMIIFNRWMAEKSRE